MIGDEEMDIFYQCVCSNNGRFGVGLDKWCRSRKRVSDIRQGSEDTRQSNFATNGGGGERGSGILPALCRPVGARGTTDAELRAV